MNIPIVQPVPLEVKLRATTEMRPFVGDPYKWQNVSSSDELAEFAGRSCYQSWDRPNPATSDNWYYIRHIEAVGHDSVLEHGSVTFYLTGISRSCTHQIVRHRHFSYSQLSQRYVDQGRVGYVMPPLYVGNISLETKFHQSIQKAIEAYVTMVEETKKLVPEAKRKHHFEAARMILPNAMETRLVMTGNHRAWREFLKKRVSDTADAEIRQVAREIRRQLKMNAPAIYQDM